MKTFEKISLLVVMGSVLLAHVLYITFVIRGMDLIWDDLIIGLVMGIFTGLLTGVITGWAITDYFRKKDKTKNISDYLYSIELYLEKLHIRLTDLRESIKGEEDREQQKNKYEKLRETLIEEPRDIFHLLADKENNLTDAQKNERRKAGKLIEDLRKKVIDNNEDFSELEALIFSSKCTKTRISILDSIRKS
ncbi:hypothetical protein NW801_13225 [Brevibacillus laterosporus]|uniref:Uncharacterized protein n=1 Tax=Brevibacillus halotolerans TaxID=1507437 RepID=A0ABT4HY53_9BACL|nr:MULTISPECIES: hypothetical protein [Brevibacillus]MCR8985983.1 hypothetical protein [Brevibacillus laterosporus]MCZ0831716.1 hypothetical protein [Brevibacillus halotolerans]